MNAEYIKDKYGVSDEIAKVVEYVFEKIEKGIMDIVHEEIISAMSDDERLRYIRNYVMEYFGDEYTGISPLALLWKFDGNPYNDLVEELNKCGFSMGDYDFNTDAGWAQWENEKVKNR